MAHFCILTCSLCLVLSFLSGPLIKCINLLRLTNWTQNLTFWITRCAVKHPFATRDISTLVTYKASLTSEQEVI